MAVVPLASVSDFFCPILSASSRVSGNFVPKVSGKLSDKNPAVALIPPKSISGNFLWVRVAYFFIEKRYKNVITFRISEYKQLKEGKLMKELTSKGV